MSYRFVIHRANGERRVRDFPTLREAIRSRHAYKKSPHFKEDRIGLIYQVPDNILNSVMGDFAFLPFKNKEVKRDASP